MSNHLDPESMTAPSAIRHIVVATDENFAMPTSVTLRSLSMHNLHNEIMITVLHNGLTEESMRGIREAIPGVSHTVRWHDVSGFDPGATTKSHLPDSTYFRLLIEDAFEDSVERLIYLDVDVLVRKDLTPLWSMDLSGAPLAAVQSLHFPYVGSPGAVSHWSDLDFDPRAPFFNAGVLVVDLDRWRSERVAKHALEYLRSPLLGRGADQEALNVATIGTWKQLPPTWNFQPPMLNEGHGVHLYFDAEEIEHARTDPAIVHFQTRPKPWHRGCEHPWRHEWLAVASDTDVGPVVDLRQRSVTDEWRWRTRRAASALVKGR